LKIRDSTHVTWSGRHRPPLTGQGVFPRPSQNPLPIWVGVGGSPESFVRAGLLGLPLMVAIIGGEPRQFAPLVDLYRRAGAHAGHAPETLQVGLHVFGYVGDSIRSATDIVYPGWQQMMSNVSRERGFARPTRAQFDATSGPDGAFFMGDPDTVATKLRRVSGQLGGVDRVSVQMTNPRMTHKDLLRGIELLGTEVAPQLTDL
jgi:alkanesulfonate monooxygenase SsuD/methylene tetrahydromethanopterin reductase-like flavin-dependent oxidoreductase (luciferase family)